MLPVSFYALQGGLMFHVKAAHELSDRIIPGNTKFMAGFNQGLNPFLHSIVIKILAVFLNEGITDLPGSASVYA